MCGIFRPGSFGVMRSTSPGIQPRPGVTSIFAAALGHELHADTNAEKRPALLADALVQRLDHAGNRIETAPAIRKGADAGQHHAVGARDRVGIAGHHDRLIVAALARGALEGLGGGMQIARAVVDDGDAHRGAPGSGNRPITSGGAARRTREERGASQRGGAAAARSARLSCRPGVEEPPLGHFEIVADHDAEYRPAAPRAASSAAALAASKPISSASSSPTKNLHRPAGADAPQARPRAPPPPPR